MLVLVIAERFVIYLLSGSQWKGKVKFQLMQIQSYWANVEREQISHTEGFFSIEFSPT